VDAAQREAAEDRPTRVGHPGATDEKPRPDSGSDHTERRPVHPGRLDPEKRIGHRHQNQADRTAEQDQGCSRLQFFYPVFV
jgi:hypothetical protein